jgi:biopolymer transport protein TolR
MRKFRHSRRLYGDLLSEINVTPFVDVLLILLVAFLISAPLLTHSLPIQLPDGKLNQRSPELKNVLQIYIDHHKNIILEDEVFSLDALKLQLSVQNNWKNKNRPVSLQMDERVPYGFLIEMMVLLKNSGFPRVGLVFRNQEN